MMTMTGMASLMETRTTMVMALRTTKIPTMMEMAFRMSMTREEYTRGKTSGQKIS